MRQYYVGIEDLEEIQSYKNQLQQYIVKETINSAIKLTKNHTEEIDFKTAIDIIYTDRSLISSNFIYFDDAKKINNYKNEGHKNLATFLIQLYSKVYGTNEFTNINSKLKNKWNKHYLGKFIAFIIQHERNIEAVTNNPDNIYNFLFQGGDVKNNNYALTPLLLGERKQENTKRTIQKETEERPSMRKESLQDDSFNNELNKNYDSNEEILTKKIHKVTPFAKGIYDSKTCFAIGAATLIIGATMSLMMLSSTIAAAIASVAVIGILWPAALALTAAGAAMTIGAGIAWGIYTNKLDTHHSEYYNECRKDIINDIIN